MSSDIRYINVPYARNHSGSTFSTPTTSETKIVKSPSDVLLDESVLDPGKENFSSRHTVCGVHSGTSFRNKSPLNSTRSESSLCKKSGDNLLGKTFQKSQNLEQLECCKVLANNPVVDPNKETSRTCTESKSKTSFSSGNYSQSARIPDDPDDKSSSQDFKVDVGNDLSDEYETDSESDADNEVSDNNVEYTPSSSCTDGYLPSGYETDDDEYHTLRNVNSRSSTLSSHKSNIARVKKKSFQRKQSKDSNGGDDANITKRKPRPKTAAHRLPVKSGIATDRIAKTASRQLGKGSLPAVKSFTTKQHQKKCMIKEQLKKKATKTQTVASKVKPRVSKSPPEKKPTTDGVKLPKTVSLLKRRGTGTYMTKAIYRKPTHNKEKKKRTLLEFRKPPYAGKVDTARSKIKPNQAFQAHVGDKFVSLVEDVVTQMSLLGDDNNADNDGTTSPLPISYPKTKVGARLKHERKTKENKCPKKAKEASPISSFCPLRADSSSKKLLVEQLFKWKNDYMRGLSMYIENQLKKFDRSNILSWNTLSNEGIHNTLNRKGDGKSSPRPSGISDPARKSCHICEKKPISMLKLKSIWSRPGTATKSGKVLPRLLISRDKVPPLGSDVDKKRLKKKVRQTLKGLRLPRNTIRILGAREIKLVCHTTEFILVGEGATSICILGNLESDKIFVIIKMFKLPYAGGRTKEIIDQSVLASHVNNSEVTPKFYGLVALDCLESTVVGVHEVAMAYKFLGHAPSCAVTTLSSLCEKVSTSQMYRDPAADTSTCQLNAVIIMKRITAAMNKIHYAGLVMPGLDTCKVSSKCFFFLHNSTSKPY